MEYLLIFYLVGYFGGKLWQVWRGGRVENVEAVTAVTIMTVLVWLGGFWS